VLQLDACADADTVLEAIVEFRHAPDALLTPLSRQVLPPSGLPSQAFPTRVRLSEAGFELEPVPAQRRRRRTPPERQPRIER
jgi:hypothetical protein